MGGCGALPKDQREFVLDQGLGPGGGRPGKAPGTVCAILTGGPALPVGLDGVALVASGTARGDRGWSEAFPDPPTPYGLLLPAPTGSRSPLTAAACVAWGTRVTRGLAIRVQEAGVREPVGMRRTGRGAGLQ